MAFILPPGYGIPTVDLATDLLPAPTMAAIGAYVNAGFGLEFVQSTPLATWSFTFPTRGRKPQVTIYTAAGVEVDADITVTTTSVSISFPSPTAGSVIVV